MVERFNVWECVNCGGPVPYYIGEWVRHADYAALQAEYERVLNAHLPQATTNAIIAGQMSMEAAFEYRARAEAAETRVKELEAKNARLEHAVEFAARQCWRAQPAHSTGSISIEERFNGIKWHPVIKQYGEPHAQLSASEGRPGIMAAHTLAIAALKPLHDMVFNDNGDLTITKTPLSYEQIEAGYRVYRALAQGEKGTDNG